MIMELKASIDDIRNVIGHPDCIEIRDIPYIQAKDEIRMFFKNNHGKEYYPSELMEQLGIEYSMVSKICEELRIEGNVQ